MAWASSERAISAADRRVNRLHAHDDKIDPTWIFDIPYTMWHHTIEQRASISQEWNPPGRGPFVSSPAGNLPTPLRCFLRRLRLGAIPP